MIKTKSDTKSPLLKLGTTLNKFNLDWEVNKIPLTYEYKGKPSTSPYYGLVRSDNGTILGNCSDEYHIGQNKDIVQALISIADGHDFEINRGGAINQGRKIYLQLELPGQVNIGPDKVTRYITALSRHDGRGALAFSLTNQVMSCSNMFNKIMQGAEYKIRHTASMAERLLEMQSAINLLINGDTSMTEQFRTWAHTDVSKDLVDEMVTYLLNTDKLDEELLSKQKIKHIESMHTVIKSEMNTKGENLWGLFNGATYYANHIKQHPSRPNGKVESILTGGANLLMNKAHSFIEANSIY
jgi:phage/plasmid-like protein (TIGR03299 family)